MVGCSRLYVVVNARLCPIRLEESSFLTLPLSDYFNLSQCLRILLATLFNLSHHKTLCKISPFVSSCKTSRHQHRQRHHHNDICCNARAAKKPSRACALPSITQSVATAIIGQQCAFVDPKLDLDRCTFRSGHLKTPHHGLSNASAARVAEAF